MTHKPSLEEVETRLRSLPAGMLVTEEDARAMARLDVFRFPTVSVAGPPAARARLAPPRLGIAPKAAAFAAALVLVVLANIGAAYYAPRYGRALADVPGVGPVSGRMLQFLGLNDRNVTVVNSAATSSGHTVRLVAGYADGLRTVLLVDVDGKALSGNPKVFGTNPGDYGVSVEALSLTDQFGHRYELSRGAQTGIALTFEPLAWPASAVGARRTLHVGAIEAEWLIGPGTDGSLKGDWNLHATLVSEAAHMLALPAPVRTPEAAYTFTSLQASGTTVIVHWSVTGAAPDKANLLWVQRTNSQSAPGSEYDQLMRDYLTPRLFDSAGKQMTTWEWGYELPKDQPGVGDMTAFVPGPGNYRFQFGDALTNAADERWIVVP